jgi:hypothetical protein
LNDSWQYDRTLDPSRSLWHRAQSEVVLPRLGITPPKEEEVPFICDKSYL